MRTKPKLKRAPGGVRYPWDSWLKKKEFFLQRRVHYNCLTYSMIMQIRNAMLKRGRRVTMYTKQVDGKERIYVKPSKIEDWGKWRI